MKKYFLKFRYLFVLLLFFGSAYIINNVYAFGLDIGNYFGFKALYLSFVFVSLILLIGYLLPKKIRRFYILFIEILLALVTIANYFYINYFNYFFSWKDLVLGREGANFISSIFPLIDIRIISVVIYFIVLIVLTFIWTTDKKIKLNKRTSIYLAIFVVIITTGYLFITQKQLKAETIENSHKSAKTLGNDSYYYTEWIDNVRLVKVVGIYEYLFRDLYRLFFVSDNAKNAYEYLEENLEDNIQVLDKDNEYYGIFKDKNLILIMMESMDDWQINKKSTPTLWRLKKEGIDFTNHHSLTYVTGKTAQSEFIANTGIYPKLNSMAPHYAYYENTFVYSLANLFRNKGYTSYAYHRTDPSTYNRKNMLLSLGYERYIDYSALGLTEENWDLDTAFVKQAYSSMVKSEKFMHFWITFSNHSPYTLTKQECSKYYKKMQKNFPNETNEEILCGYAQAYETDQAIKYLIDNLKKDDLLDDTVIIGFSDHPNSVYMSDEENERHNYTQMFVYNTELKHKEINKLTNTINILPMINNLFALDSEYFMASYDPLSSDESYLIYDDLTVYEDGKYSQISNDRLKLIDTSKNLLISDYYKEK